MTPVNFKTTAGAPNPHYQQPKPSESPIPTYYVSSDTTLSESLADREAKGNPWLDILSQFFHHIF